MQQKPQLPNGITRRHSHLKSLMIRMQILVFPLLMIQIMGQPGLPIQA